MKFRFFDSLIALSLLLLVSCQDDQSDSSGTATVNFSYDLLREVEGATQPLTINIGIDGYNHPEGTISIDITGGDYGSDYTTNEGSASFDLDVPANALLANFSIQTLNDDVIENDKTLSITIAKVTGGLTLGDKTSFNFTILDDDNPLVAMIAFENASGEVKENTTNAFPVTILFDQKSTDGGTITIETSGDAVFGTDYTIEGVSAVPFTIDVPANATAAAFNMLPIDNSAFAENKSATFTLSAVSGGLKLGTQTENTVTILNDDDPPSPVIDFSSASATVDEAAGKITIDFNLSGTTNSDATVDVAVNASGTATLGTDFDINGQTTNPYTLNIPSGSSSVSIDINIMDDTDYEGDETIVLDLANATGGIALGATTQKSVMTITDNDTPALFSYVETFESFDGSATYLNDVLKYQNIVLPAQTLDDTQIISLINNSGGFNALDNTSTSDNGLNIFYNSQTTTVNGTLDNVVITPVLQGNGAMMVNIDVAYAFKAQNTANITYYWSQTYDGSGTFNESDWTVMGGETANDMSNEGYPINTYKREAFNINPTADFYMAIRVNMVVDDTNYRMRWRFDNIQVNEQ